MARRIGAGAIVLSSVALIAGCGGSSVQYDRAKTEACVRARPEFVPGSLPQPARDPLSIQIFASEPIPAEAGVGKAWHLDVSFTEAGESRSTDFVQLLFMPDAKTARQWIERADAGAPPGAAVRKGNVVEDWYGNEGSNTVRIPPDPRFVKIAEDCLTST